MAALRLDQTRAGAAGAAISTPEAQAIPRPGRNGQRDDQVRSERLLDTDRYPVMTFRSEDVDGLALTTRVPAG